MAPSAFSRRGSSRGDAFPLVDPTPFAPFSTTTIGIESTGFAFSENHAFMDLNPERAAPLSSSLFFAERKSLTMFASVPLRSIGLSTA